MPLNIILVGSRHCLSIKGVQNRKPWAASLCYGVLFQRRVLLIGVTVKGLNDLDSKLVSALCELIEMTLATRMHLAFIPKRTVRKGT